LTHASALPARAFPVFSALAEHSLLVEFGDRIAPDVHARVMQLDQALADTPFAGFLEAVPAYAGLLIRFDPLVSDHGLAEQAARLAMSHGAAVAARSARREVLICYDDDLAPDLGMIAEAAGLTREAAIAAHLAGRYDVFMYGFAPGYAYLAGVPKAIRLPRKPAAIRDVPAGSVVIAGPQCLVTTITMPTGWWIIGRSPTRILTGEADRPFLFDVGDQVRFRRIGRDDYDAEAAR
jgi:inhibitor of KinA